MNRGERNGTRLWIYEPFADATLGLQVENHLARGRKGRIGPGTPTGVRFGFNPVVKIMERDAADRQLNSM